MLESGDAPRRRLGVFVSSAMQELKDERQVIKAVLDELKINAWVYESDAGARDENTRAIYLRELKAADLYIGVFWKRYGAYTIDEYRQAVTWQKPRLIFVKRAADEERDQELRAFLAEVTGVDSDRGAGWFASLDDLREIIKNSVQGWQADVVHRASGPPLNVPFQVEPFGDQYVERTSVLEQARAAWLPKEPGGALPVTRAAFHGLGGSGKSVMARAFAHDPIVRRVFSDGVLSATLARDGGQPIDITQIQSTWCRALQDKDMPPAGYTNEIASSAQLRTLLQDKACLLLVDDVWDSKHIDPWFLVGGPRCLLLITTRSLDVAGGIGATPIELSSMTAQEGLSLIERWNGELAVDDRAIALALGDEIGWLPLALELMAARAKSLGWTTYRDQWRHQRLSALKRGRRGAGPQNNVADSFELSYASLKDDADVYKRLAVFGANMQFPPSAAAALWDMSEAEARELLGDLANQALLTRVGLQPDARYMLHSLLHEFLVERLGTDLAVTHSALVDGYRRRSKDGWAGVPDDGYFGDRLVFHLVEAGRVREVWELFDRPWMEARFKRGMSHVPFLADLRVGLQTARREPVDVTAFIRCAVIYVAVSALAANDPPNLPAALAEFGDVDIALNRAATMSGANTRPQAYIDIAEVLLDRNRAGEALVAAERAVAVADGEVEGYRGIKMLAKAAACLGRCGRDTGDTLARARDLAVTAPVEENTARVDALAAVIEGYAAVGQPQAVADVVRQMVQMIAAADPDDSRLMFTEASKALQAIGAVEALRALADIAAARMRDGLGGYPLMNVAPALAACGDFEAALRAARQIPEAYAIIEVFSDIAVLLFRADRRDDAGQLFREAVEALEREIKRDSSAWRLAKPPLKAAAVLATTSSLESLLASEPPSDAVWHSWFLAGLARALKQSGGDAARIGEIARQSRTVLCEALAKDRRGIHGESVRADTAGFLAEAGAVADAVTMAEDIDDVRYQKEALTAVAVQQWRAGRADEARALLLRALVAGRPDGAMQAVGLAAVATALARLGDSRRALDTIESCLQLLQTLQWDSEEQIAVRAAAVEVCGLLGQAGKARDLAAQTVDFLARHPGPVIFDDDLRSKVVYLAAKTGAVEALESRLTAITNWYYRRTIARGVVRGFGAIGQPERGRRFFEDLESNKQGYPPWNEMPKVDALARLFAMPDDAIRRWVLDAVGGVRSPTHRSVLLARCASALADHDSRAADLGRSSIDVAAGIEDPAQRQTVLTHLAIWFARACAGDLLAAALAGVEDPATKDQALGELAMALARRGRTADAAETVKSMPPGSTRNFWTIAVADFLLDAKQYDAARAVYGPFYGWPAGVDREYADVHTALTLARDGERERAQAIADEVMAREDTWRDEDGDGDFSLVRAELALCFAYLGAAGTSLELANRAREDGGWVPFVSATSAAACAVAGNRFRADAAAAGTLGELKRLPRESLPERVHQIARTWTRVDGFDGFERLLSMAGAVEDESTRGTAIGELARGAGAALTPAQLNRSIDRASTIQDEWIRVGAMKSLLETAAARRDQAALANLLQKTSALDNDWAASDLIVALAAAAAPIGDEDLLNQILTWTSEQRAQVWTAAAAVAEATRVALERGDRARADPLIRRAREAAGDELREEERTRAIYDAETLSCLSLLERRDEAGIVLDRVIDAARKTPAGWYRDSILAPLESAIDDLDSFALAKVASAFVSESPRIAAAAALALARLGRAAEAADLVERVNANPAGAAPADRTGILFLSARTLAALNRTDDGVRYALDALNVARTLEPGYQGETAGLLAEALADLRHGDGVAALHDALVTTAAWWDRASPTPAETSSASESG